MLTKQLKSIVELMKRKIVIEENWIIGAEKIIWEVMLSWNVEEKNKKDMINTIRHQGYRK